jgi:heme/copper-type cytochrome/quinol oxidase subunit 2
MAPGENCQYLFSVLLVLFPPPSCARVGLADLSVRDQRKDAGEQGRRHVEEGVGMQTWCVRIYAVLGILFLAACGGDDAPTKSTTPSPSTSVPQAEPPSAAAPTVIEVTLSFVAPRFRPDPIVVQVGKPVQFKVASADTRHHLAIESLGIDIEVPQKALDERVTTTVVTPQETGTFRMLCRIHSRLAMEGTLQVTDTGAAGN